MSVVTYLRPIGFQVPERKGIDRMVSAPGATFEINTVHEIEMAVSGMLLA